MLQGNETNKIQTGKKARFKETLEKISLKNKYLK